MRRLGARAERVTAKIIGGASMFGNLIPAGGINIGERNIAAVRDVLADARVPIVGRGHRRATTVAACFCTCSPDGSNGAESRVS